jgi:hypothetical protein
MTTGLKASQHCADIKAHKTSSEMTAVFKASWHCAATYGTTGTSYQWHTSTIQKLLCNYKETLMEFQHFIRR